MSDAALHGTVIDERYEFNITEICRACGGTTEWLVELVEEGVLEPRDRAADDWRFPGHALPRARTALRLQRDLGLNTPGVALAIEMLEEIERLRARLRRFETEISDE